MSSDLQTSYERLARMYTKKSGIEVIVKGDTFFTDKDRIIVAEIPEELNKELRDPSLAGLLHECMEVKHTKFLSLREAFKNPKFLKYKGLYNNINDSRLYKLGLREYPGYKGLQKAGLTFIRDILLIPTLDECAPPEKRVNIDLASLLGICIHYRISEMETDFLPKTVNEMADITQSIWENVRWKAGHEGSIQADKITDQILQKLKDFFEDYKKEKGKEGEKGEKGEGEEKGGEAEEEGEKKGEGGDEEGEGEDEDKGEMGKVGGKGGEKGEKEEDDEEEDEEEEDEESEKSGESGEGDEGEEGEGEGKRGADKGSGYDGKNLEKDLEKILNPTELSSDDSDFEKPLILSEGLMQMLTDEIGRRVQNWNSDREKHIPHPRILIYDVEEHIDNPFKNRLVNDTTETQIKVLEKKHADIVAKIDKEVERLKTKILPLLISEKRSSYLFEQSEGIIDDAYIYKLLLGNGKIYKRKIPGRKVNTAVTILNDVSGSMGGRKIDMLRPTLLSISDALFALKIPFEILTFTTAELEAESSKEVFKLQSEYERMCAHYRYNRVEPVEHIIVKAFNENYYNVRKLIPLIQARRNNFDNEAIVWAAKRLAERREERKILFVLSDGMPSAAYTDDNLLEKDLKEQIRKIERSGIEVIGIGLIDNSVRKFYPTFEIISETSHISAKVYKALLMKLKNNYNNRERQRR